jgi:hypothetical protein
MTRWFLLIKRIVARLTQWAPLWGRSVVINGVKYRSRHE